MTRLVIPPIDQSALHGWSPGGQVVDLGGDTMGTVWRVRLALPAPADLRPLHAALQGELDTIVAEMSHWEPTSVLSRFNQAPAGHWTMLPPGFAHVIAAALQVAERSAGAFDPTAGALVDLWGFGPVPADAPPTDQAIAQALATAGWSRLAFDAAARRLHQPGGLRLDLSGIAKGHAVDRLAATLVARGHRHALVEVGGEFVGLGLRPDGDPWWVELETPGTVAAPMRVALHQGAVATSGDYVRGRHTLDPRTGHPVADTLAVSVLHPSAMLADAWATALTVASPEERARLCKAEGLAARILHREGDAVVEWLSPALQTLLVEPEG